MGSIARPSVEPPSVTLTALFRWLLAVSLGVFAVIASAMAEPAQPRGDAAALREAERAHATLKMFDRDGHPWRVAREDWDGARRRVASDAAWAAWLVRERRAVDDWMRLRHDRADWKPGWGQDFVSPRDGSRLKWTAEIPGEQTAFLHSPSDPRVAITPKLAAAWVALFRGRHAAMMRRAALLYRLTGEARYGEWAAGQLDFYAEHYLGLQPQRPNQGARLYWQSLDEAVNGIWPMMRNDSASPLNC